MSSAQLEVPPSTIYSIG